MTITLPDPSVVGQTLAPYAPVSGVAVAVAAIYGLTRFNVRYPGFRTAVNAKLNSTPVAYLILTGSVAWLCHLADHVRSAVAETGHIPPLNLTNAMAFLSMLLGGVAAGYGANKVTRATIARARRGYEPAPLDFQAEAAKKAEEVQAEAVQTPPPAPAITCDAMSYVAAYIRRQLGSLPTLDTLLAADGQLAVFSWSALKPETAATLSRLARHVGADLVPSDSWSGRHELKLTASQFAVLNGVCERAALRSTVGL